VLSPRLAGGTFLVVDDFDAASVPGSHSIPAKDSAGRAGIRDELTRCRDSIGRELYRPAFRQLNGTYPGDQG